jgi:hypothetical protein
MGPETIATAVGIGHALIAFILPPWLMFGIYRKRSLKRWVMPLVVAVSVAWFLRLIYRTTIEAPHYITVARGKGDDMYDGVGGNVATLLTAWFEPLMMCLLFLGIVRIFNRIRKSKPGDAGNGGKPIGDEQSP